MMPRRMKNTITLNRLVNKTQDDNDKYVYSDIIMPLILWWLYNGKWVVVFRRKSTLNIGTDNDIRLTS